MPCYGVLPIPLTNSRHVRGHSRHDLAKILMIVVQTLGPSFHANIHFRTNFDMIFFLWAQNLQHDDLPVERRCVLNSEIPMCAQHKNGKHTWPHMQ